ncbi:prophage MuSo2, F protein, putative [Vibrio scophthalmi LMG 19158]|uniref:Prophage MuSo2, F protein, putative n=1 Tax=Vibrio scophthalmi LMG 19158 TaxID=870967 RepID=F9RLS8_9VIBR|nr:prophage MuSo2, F protein, putative [Vibrio scophthalmi LMG 19158]
MRQISQYEYDKLKVNGLSARVAEMDANGIPTGRFTQESIAVRTDAPAVRMEPYVNKRTGELTMVPQGIDPGWAYHPQYRRLVLDRELEQKEAAYQAAVKGTAV